MPDEADDEPRDDEITLEEWIASTQSCCGVEPDRDSKKQVCASPSLPPQRGVRE